MAIHVYLETSVGSGVFKHRGEAGPNDDPKGFVNRMAAAGLKVLMAGDFVGAKVDHKMKEIK